MKTIFLVLMLLTISALHAQPSNDECSGAIEISGITSPQTVIADMSTATESLDASCETGSNNNTDLWYSFTMPFDGQIRLTGIFGFNRISLFDLCGGTELSCQVGNGFIYGLSNSTTYFLRYSAYNYTATDQFVIQAFDPATNDECNSAELINDISTAQSISTDTRTATESLNAGCEDVQTDNLDLWYSFTMPFDGQVRITGVFGFNRVVLYDACNGNELACLPGNGFFYGLDASESYILRYAANSNISNPDDFTIQAFPPPANDECIGAELINDISSAQTISTDTRMATESLDAGCEDAQNDNLDLWYSFTMPFDGQVRITGVFGFNRVVVYDACNGNELGCLAGNGFIYGLNGSESYILRYAASSGFSNPDDFTIQAFPPPENDECNGSILINNIASVQSISLDAREATESLDAGCEEPQYNNLDLWYHFIMPFDGQLRVTGVFGNNRIALYDACGGSEIHCSVGHSYFNGLLAGNNYWLRYAAISAQAGEDDFEVQAFPVPPNDECNNATAIGDISTPQTLNPDNRGSNESLETSCELAGEDYADLWYSFTMPLDGELNIPGIPAEANITVFDGCSGDEIACLGSASTINGLNSGQSYLLRYATTGDLAGPGSFTILASQILPIELVSIEGWQEKGSVVLEWVTASESNNAGFEILRSQNTREWEELGWIEGNGNTLETHFYRYIDESPGTGNNYYRLKQIDLDGSYQYSSVVRIDEPDVAPDFTLYPNPASDHIYISNTHSQEIRLSGLFGLNGNIIPIHSRNNEIDVSGLPAGVYILQILAGSKMVRKKLVIAR